MELIGKERVDYTSKDGKRVLGYNLFCTSDVEPNVEGTKTEAVYIADSQIPEGVKLDLGIEFEIIRDARGWFQRMIFLTS